MPPGTWRFYIHRPRFATHPRASMARSARAIGGFTLIETLVTVGLLTIVVLTCSSLLTDGLVSTRQTRWDNLARTAALAEIERLKTLPWATIAALPPDAPLTEPDGDPANGIAANGIADNLEDLPGAAGRVYVENYDMDGPGPGVPDGTVKQITVSVSVYGAQNILKSLGDVSPNTGSARSIWRMTTLMSEHGP